MALPLLISLIVLAVLAPVTPPPMITTSAVRGIVMGRC